MHHVLVSVEQVPCFSRKVGFCYWCSLSSFPAGLWAIDDKVWWVILHWIKYTAIWASSELWVLSFVRWSDSLCGINLSTVLCVAFRVLAKVCFEEISKSLGGTKSVEKGPDFLHIAATVILRVLQLTPDTPKCLGSCGSEGNEKEKIWTQQQNITLPWFSQYQVMEKTKKKQIIELVEYSWMPLSGCLQKWRIFVGMAHM